MIRMNLNFLFLYGVKCIQCGPGEIRTLFVEEAALIRMEVSSESMTCMRRGEMYDPCSVVHVKRRTA